MDELETPTLAAEPPVDEAASAQEARERAALRSARGQLRRTPVALTEQFPAQISSDEQYQALAPGSTFTDPSGSRRVKPWYVTDDASFDLVPEGVNFVDPQGQLRSKPRYDDLPFGTQTLYNMAVNDRERLRILEQAYPGKVKSTGRGELYIDEGDGVRRKARGFSQAPGAFIASQAAPVGASVLGEIGAAQVGHRIAPFIGGMLGGIAGGGAGAVGGQLFNDMVLQIAGVYDRTGAEQAANLGTAGVLGAAGSTAGRVLLPMAPNLARWGKEAAPAALAKFLGANKANVDTAVGLAEQGVKVPPSAWAKEAPHLQNITEVLDPAFRTQRVLEQSATGHMEQRAGTILRELGVEDAGSLVKPTAAVPTNEAGAAIKARMMQESAATDQVLADRIAQVRAQTMAEDVLVTMNRSTASEQELLRTVEANQHAAQQLINEGFRDIERSVDGAMRAAGADVNSGSLWQQVAERLRSLRQAVVQRHSRWYAQADEVAGDAHPNLGMLPQTAEQFVGQLPQGFENRYPAIVRQLREIAEGEVPPTFGQLHNLRSQLRHEVNWYELNTDITEGSYKFFSNQLNNVLHDPNATGNLRLAAQMLDATDRSYGANMAAFNDQRLRAVVKGIESGLPADPKVLYDTLVREGRSDLTHWVADRVGPNLWAGVRAADVQEMLNASRTLVDGSYDGAAFAREVLKRHRDGMLESVHGRDAARLVRQAQDIQLANGSVDIPVRPGDTLSEIVMRGRQATEAAQTAARQSPMDTLESEMRRVTREHRQEVGAIRRDDPLNFLYKPTVGATEAVNRILAKEDTILAAAARFGEKSPEFEMLRQIWAQRMLRETMKPSERLAGVSPQVQQLMFPGISLENMQLLAKEMDFLMGTKAAKGGAGRSIMATERVEHPWAAIPGGRAVGKFIPGVDAMGRAILGAYYQTMTDFVTSPALLRFVQKGLQGDEASRFTVRNLVQAMLYGKGANRGGAIGSGVAAGQASVPFESPPFDPQALGAQQAPEGNWAMPGQP